MIIIIWNIRIGCFTKVMTILGWLPNHYPGWSCRSVLFVVPPLLSSWNSCHHSPELRCSPSQCYEVVCGMGSCCWVLDVSVCGISLSLFFLDVHLMSCLFLQCKLLCSPGKVCSTPLPSCCVVVLVLVALHWLDGPDLLQTAVFVQDLIAIY